MIGWSTGGAAAMKFCADYPTDCHRLILLASASTRGYPFFGTDENGQPDVTKRLKSLNDKEKTHLEQYQFKGHMIRKIVKR